MRNTVRENINTRIQDAVWAAARISTLDALKHEMKERGISEVHLNTARTLFGPAKAAARRDSDKGRRVLCR